MPLPGLKMLPCFLLGPDNFFSLCFSLSPTMFLLYYRMWSRTFSFSPKFWKAFSPQGLLYMPLSARDTLLPCPVPVASDLSTRCSNAISPRTPSLTSPRKIKSCSIRHFAFITHTTFKLTSAFFPGSQLLDGSDNVYLVYHFISSAQHCAWYIMAE